MNACLLNNPDERPTFEQIDLTLKGMDLKDVEPTDSHFFSMNRQSEKLFPPSVLEALQEGRRIEPESRGSITILVASIVSVKDHSTDLSPEKILDMINRVYSQFDRLIQYHGVFKIGTVNDTYMVVCNLISDQPDHARLVIEFGLSALRVANETLIDPECPERGTVGIRLGIHSGPVIANVVGSRNAHYSLFGDTVNTAFQLESESIQNRIHCSPVSAKLIHDQCPEIRIRARGTILIKGKGEMQTYWASERNADTRSESEASGPPLVGPGKVDIGKDKDGRRPSSVTVSTRQTSSDPGFQSMLISSPRSFERPTSLELLMKYRNSS